MQTILTVLFGFYTSFTAMVSSEQQLQIASLIPDYFKVFIRSESLEKEKKFWFSFGQLGIIASVQHDSLLWRAGIVHKSIQPFRKKFLGVQPSQFVNIWPICHRRSITIWGAEYWFPHGHLRKGHLNKNVHNSERSHSHTGDSSFLVSWSVVTWSDESPDLSCPPSFCLSNHSASHHPFSISAM